MNEYISKLKLLYVEDNSQIRGETTELLEEIIGSVITAENGKEGLELFLKERPDLVITDIQMPVMDGLEMVKEIRKVDKDVPVIVVSAHTETEAFIKSIELGVDGYILKPLNLSQFMDTLERVAEKIYLKREADRYMNLLKQYQEAMDQTLLVSKTDPKGVITYANDRFCEVSGYTREELIGKPHNIVRHPDMPKELFRDMWATIQAKRTWQGVIKNRAKNGTPYYVYTVIKPILDEEDEITEYISLRYLITDIVSHKRMLDSLLKYYDSFLVAILKIDDYEYIENLYSNERLNALDREIIGYIRNAVPRRCSFSDVFSIEGGKYVLARSVKAEDITEELIDKSVENLKRLQRYIADLDFKSIDYNLSISISFAYGKDAFEIARLGLEKLKETKRDFVIANEYYEQLKNRAHRRVQTLEVIKKAIAREGITAFFQPIVSNSDLKVRRYEALVRLIDEEGNYLSPAQFLDVAKESKYYGLITQRVLEIACRLAKSRDISVSVNLSILDIETDTIRERVLKILHKNKEIADKILFELVESEDVKDFSLVERFVEEVKGLGVKIAIDDFGSGYSNFERLAYYQPDILKIDGSLVKNLKDSEYSRNLVEAIVSFSKRQGLETVAEFVENEEMLNTVRRMGIDYSQGYFLGKPQPMEVDVIDEGGSGC